MLVKKAYILFVLWLMTANMCAQDSFVLTSVPGNDSRTVQVKWYSKSFSYPEGVNLYRKEGSETTWTKVNDKPIKKDEYRPSPAELKQERELSTYIDLVNSLDKLEGISLLASYLYSFKSEAFCKYLGIAYTDQVTDEHKTVQYKVRVLKNGQEQDLATSEPITTGYATVPEPPREISIVAKNKKALITWLPETSRYYGVDIFRVNDSTVKQAQKITKEPIILSKTKNKAGELVYPEQFFIDDNLKEDTVYLYSLKCIDFFGKESAYSPLIQVFIKDVNAPAAPTITDKIVTEKKVTLTWNKQTKEKDLEGFNLYRAYKNEREYRKINATMIDPNDSIYTDSVDKTGYYRYVVAAVDRSGNEGRSEEMSLEVIDNEPPATPKGLVITSDTGKIRLSWQANTEEDLRGYLVYQSIKHDTKDDAYVLITPEPLKVNMFTQELAKNSRNKFLYKVLAMDSSYNKSKLSAYAVTTLPDVTPPEAPFIKDVYLNEKRQVVIEFFKNTERDLKGYNVYRVYADDNIEITEKVNVNTLDKEQYRYLDRDLDKFGLLKYYVIAMDSANNESKKSNIVRLTIPKPEEKANYEFKKFEAKALRVSNYWKLKWKINSADEVFYVVYTRADADDQFEPQTKNLMETTCRIHLKSTNKTYVQVRAYTKKGLVAKSEVKVLEKK